MTWIKLDDNAVDHPKVETLSDRAFRWWIKGLSYASRFLTNGLLPPIFWKKVPTPDRKELTKNKLWDWDDPNFQIHDYLSHQSSKEVVSQKKADTAERVRKFRETKRNALHVTNGNALPPQVVTQPVTLPDTEIRVQRSDTEIREQRQQQNTAPPPLIKSAAYIEKRRQQCAFIGARLEVPNTLHDDLCRLLGGSAPDADLEAWYESVDAEIEVSGESIAPDVFRWLKARYAAWKPSAVNGSVSAQIDAWGRE